MPLRGGRSLRVEIKGTVNEGSLERAISSTLSKVREAAASALAMAASGEWKVRESKGARGPSRETLSLTAETREGGEVWEVSVSGYQDQSCKGNQEK